MESKSNLVKSRSSNSAITKKSIERRNKKCPSNAEFKPVEVLKKRGVYVEKRYTMTHLNGAEVNPRQEKPKAPPRPRQGKNKFLASVLTILSKSTKETQYPDPQNTKRTKRDTKKENNVANSNLKAKKFRSKVLNDNARDNEHVLVLKSEQEIVQTPSMYSDNSFNKTNGIDFGNDHYERRNENYNELVKGVIEGKCSERGCRTEKKVTIDDDAKTLVDVSGTNDKKLLNFFVDLLQNTISAYNVNEINDRLSDSSTKLGIEIDKAVAEKLDIKTEPIEVDKIPSNHFYCLKDEQVLKRENDNKVIKQTSKSRKNQLKTNSLTRKPLNILKAQSQSLDHKKVTRKEKKKTLMNLFKEELSADDAFYEPRNLYQALKVIAENKRNYEKKIHFEEKRGNGIKVPECTLRAKKVLVPTKRRGKKKRIASIESEFENLPTDNDSFYSLQVLGYDYDSSVRSPQEQSRNEILSGFHSSVSGTGEKVSRPGSLRDLSSDFHRPYVRY